MNLLNELSLNLSCVKKQKSVGDFCALYCSAINEEINYMKKENKKKYILINGKIITQVDEKYIYSFESDIELSLFPDLKFNIFLNDNEFLYGNVISCEDNIIMFSCRKLPFALHKKIEISFDAWFILENLEKRLVELSYKNNLIVEQLVYGDTTIKSNTELQYGKNKAVEMACSNMITFIWGPPGTGKTYTLADIVVKMLSQRKRILMLSYSNISVDGAVLEVEKHLESFKLGEIIRYGYPKDKRLLDYNNLLTSYNVALKKNEDFKSKQKELIRRKEKVGITNQEYEAIQEELNKIRKMIKSDEVHIVETANFVATTLSKAVCDSVIYNQKFDAVIIDEASMAYTPQVIFAASLAKEHFCCIGDFNQLPPIVQNRNKKNALNFDVFKYCGDLNNMVILNEQRRMHEKIAKFISKNMYFGLLKSHESTNIRNEITECEPFRNKPITYVDIHEFNSKTRIVGTSHCNLISSLICIGIAQKAIDNNEYNVGIITPYNEQAKFTNSLLRVLFSEPERSRITCATVHQFQGSQRDIIIYDAVDAKGEINYPGSLLSSNKNNISNRLFNVAMTRTKGKFIVVADKEFIDSGLTKGEKENTKQNKSLFYKLSRCAINENLVIEDLRFLANHEPNQKINCFYSNENALNIYLDDLKNAKDCVRFDISRKISNQKLHKQYSNIIKSLDKKLARTSFNVDSYLNKSNDYHYFDVEKKNRVLVDITIIDDEILWVGSIINENLPCWRIKCENIATKISKIQ